jgi:spermidine/putrescine transport system ATP-binding protein
MADDAILLRGIGKRFGSTTAVSECDLSVARGSFVSLLGPSGCGKTTLLRIIGGFERQDRGDVLIAGRVVNRLPPNKRDVSTVFQRYALFPHRSVGDNVGFALEVARVAKRDRVRRVEEMLELVRLPGSTHRNPATLSGGEAQRVALARALIGRPQVLLLDEPLAALDLKLRKAMQLELRRIHEELGTTFLYVTHDQEEALTMSDTIIVMNEGRIVQHGPPAEIYDHPATVFASTFIGETNLLAGKVESVSDDVTIVALDSGHRVVSSRGRSSAGDPVVVSIRPEQLAVNSPTRSVDYENHVVGLLRRRIFLGNVVRLIAEVEGGLTLTAELPHSSDSALSEGARIGLGWNRRDGIVLPDETAYDPARARPVP